MNAMAATHKASMNLRFVERLVREESHLYGPNVVTSRKVRVLQQMMVPHDWEKHDMFWQDVPLYDENDVSANTGVKPPSSAGSV